MGLISCKECNKEISDNAKSCPGCGAKTESAKFKDKNVKNTIIAVVGACACILVIVLIYNATAYGKPADMNQETFNIGKDILTVADDFMKGDIDKEVANDTIDDLREDIDMITVLENEELSQLNTEIKIGSLGRSIYFGTKAEVKEDRNDLAIELNQKKK